MRQQIMKWADWMITANIIITLLLQMYSFANYFDWYVVKIFYFYDEIIMWDKFDVICIDQLGKKFETFR